MSLSSGKASGKPVVHAFDGCEHWPQGTGKRIAELEAALHLCSQVNEAQRKAHEETWARAEKAEAEVERLSLSQRKATPKTDAADPAAYRWGDHIWDPVQVMVLTHDEAVIRFAARKERDEG